MSTYFYVIKAGKFNVAPGHFFSGSKGNVIPGPGCKNPAPFAVSGVWPTAHL